MRYIQNSLIRETVVKFKDRAEAARIFNYPFPAIEESLVNAVYHRSYEQREPVEVRINPDGIEIKANRGPDGHPVDGIPSHPYYTVHDIFGVVLFLMWGEFFRTNMILALRGTGFGETAILAAWLGFWLLRELAWWWSISVLAALVLRLLWQSESARWLSSTFARRAAVADPAGTFVYANTAGDAFTFTAGATSFGTGSGSLGSLGGLKIVPGKAVMLAGDAVFTEPVS